MTFQEFAAAHGLVINHIVHDKWKRVPTTDHQHKCNGAYLHRGDVAWAQNWATMSEPAVWHNDNADAVKLDPRALARRRQQDAADRLQAQRQAARTAQLMLGRTELARHAYLDSKGYPDTLGPVLVENGKSPLLCIPMCVGKEVVGMQKIDIDGNKKFLFGQRTIGAEYSIGISGARQVLCEGYATGLSVVDALLALKTPFRVRICFSAHNLELSAKAAPAGSVVIADNDATRTGEMAAHRSGKAYYLPPEVGQDFNDFFMAVGKFRASQELRQFLRGA